MTATTLELTAADPIVARDGRPFGVGQGNRMRAVGWPYPSVVAGSFRTAIGKVAERDFTKEDQDQLLAAEVHGFFPQIGRTLYLPAPNDCVVEEPQPKEYQLHRTTPAKPEEGAGCDWPGSVALWPVLLDTDKDFKPQAGPAWWPVEKLADWLVGQPITFDREFLQAPVREIRDHVQLDPVTGTAAESRLFSTAGLALHRLPRWDPSPQNRSRSERFASVTLAVRVRAEGWIAERAARLDTLHPLGGERRLAHWKADPGDPWQCPAAVTGALAGANKIRMVLATPAVFAGGWRPGWLDPTTLTGRPDWWPAGPSLKLVAVSIARWQAVSGWSLAEPRGPKPVKRLVPAGGVYFFETNDDAAPLAGRWLESVSDKVQDRRDGFGLAVWGTW